MTKKNRTRITWRDLDMVGLRYIDHKTLAEIGAHGYEKPVSRQRVHQVINKVRKFLAAN